MKWQVWTRNDGYDGFAAWLRLTQPRDAVDIGRLCFGTWICCDCNTCRSSLIPGSGQGSDLPLWWWWEHRSGTALAVYTESERFVHSLFLFFPITCIGTRFNWIPEGLIGGLCLLALDWIRMFGCAFLVVDQSYFTGEWLLSLFTHYAHCKACQSHIKVCYNTLESLNCVRQAIDRWNRHGIVTMQEALGRLRSFVSAGGQPSSSTELFSHAFFFSLQLQKGYDLI